MTILLREAKELSQEKILRNIKAILKSEYFQQYEIGGSRAKFNGLVISDIGGLNFRVESYRHFKLGDVSEPLVSLINSSVKSGLNLIELFLRLYTPQEKKESFGFTSERADELEMMLRVSAQGINEPLRMPEVYNFSAFNSFNDLSKREARKYRNWQKEISEELDRILLYVT